MKKLIIASLIAMASAGAFAQDLAVTINTNAATSAPAAAPAATPTDADYDAAITAITPKGAAWEHFARVLSDDDKDVALDGGTVSFDYKIAEGVKTPAQIYKAFKANEIKAKKQFGEQPFVAKFKIKQIGLDAMGETRVSAAVDQFHEVFFKGVPEDKLMDLEAGQTIRLVCQGGDFMAILPIIKNCQLDKDFMATMPDALTAEITPQQVYKNPEILMWIFYFDFLRDQLGEEKLATMTNKQIYSHIDEKLSKKMGAKRNAFFDSMPGMRDHLKAQFIKARKGE